MKKAAFLIMVLAVSVLAGEEEKAAWTFMFYGAGDTDCEPDMIKALGKVRDHLDLDGSNFLVMIDRSPKYSNDADVFGEDFSDTRIYSLKNQKFELLEKTGELNSGDPASLKRLIRLGKSKYPAQYYGLIFFSHGNGPTFCPDESDDDLTPVEVSTALTAKDSVDFVGMDVCSMASMENAYQWRPGANRFGTNYFLASASLSFPWPYTWIMSEIKPKELTPEGLGRLIMASLDRQMSAIPDHHEEKAFQSWVFLDLSKVEAVRRTVDALKKGPTVGVDPALIHYGHGFRNPAKAPFVDLYDWLHAAKKAGAGVDDALAAVDAMVLDSFGLSTHKGFEKGKHGVYFIANTREWGYDWRPAVRK